MFNHSKMILDPLVSDVGYDKEKPEMDDGRSSLRWWISQRMTLKSTVSPLTSSLSGGDADKSQQGDDKKCPRRSRVSVFAPISISRQARRAALDCCQAYFSKMVAIPARADTSKFLRQQEGGRNKNSQALPSKSRWECFLLRIRFEEWENVMYRMVDTMTMRTLCRAQICLRVCVCVCVEAEFMRRNCDSATVDVIRVSLFRVLRCAFFSFFI